MPHAEAIAMLERVPRSFRPADLSDPVELRAIAATTLPLPAATEALARTEHRSFEFRISEACRWSDGEPVSGHDFVAALEAVRQRPTHALYPLLEDVVELRGEPGRVLIELGSPQPLFTEALMQPQFSPWRSDETCGPYRIAAAAIGELLLVANRPRDAASAGDSPERIRWIEAARLGGRQDRFGLDAYFAGAIDVTADLPSSVAAALPALRARPDFHCLRSGTIVVLARDPRVPAAPAAIERLGEFLRHGFDRHVLAAALSNTVYAAPSLDARLAQPGRDCHASAPRSAGSSALTVRIAAAPHEHALFVGLAAQARGFGIELELVDTSGEAPLAPWRLERRTSQVTHPYPLYLAEALRPGAEPGFAEAFGADARALRESPEGPTSRELIRRLDERLANGSRIVPLIELPRTFLRRPGFGDLALAGRGVGRRPDTGFMTRSAASVRARCGA